MKQYKVFSYTLLFFAFATVIGCSSSSNSPQTNSKGELAGDTLLHLPVITLQAQDTILKKSYVADIQAVKNVEIRARVKGFLEKIYIDEGKTVKKGQLLFKLNDQEFKVSLSQAKAALSNAMAAAKATALEVNRVKLLVDKKVISHSELEVAQSKLNADNATIEEAKAMVQSAQNHLAYTNIYAPFDGIIDRIPLKAGSLIDEGTLLTSISDTKFMYAYFSFPENEYLNYVRNSHNSTTQTNEKVSLILADGLEFQYKGEIETVEGEIEQNTGSINFRAKFPNPQGLLRHGATGKIFISTNVENVVMVPQQSVFDIQDKSYVYLVDAAGMLRMQSFTPSTRIAQYYIIEDGLKQGDKVLYEGIQNVRDGMVIKPKQIAKDSLLALK